MIAELCGVGLLIVLLATSIRRGPGDLVRHDGKRTRAALRLPGPVSGGGADGVLRDVRVRHGRCPGRGDRRASPAGSLGDLAGARRRRSRRRVLLILFGILAVSDPRLPELGTISGGLPFLVKNVLGEKLGVLLLVEVIFAVFVCALAVHAAAVRLMFAMARDNNLPFARALSHVSPRTRSPIVPPS